MSSEYAPLFRRLLYAILTNVALSFLRGIYYGVTVWGFVLFLCLVGILQ